jgi:hypothetical protein
VNSGHLVPDQRAERFLGLAGAHIVATDALLTTRDNLADVIDAKAMMCVHGNAGLSKTLSVDASLRELAPEAMLRIQFRARPTARDIRHVCSTPLPSAATRRASRSSVRHAGHRTGAGGEAGRRDSRSVQGLVFQPAPS